MNIIRGMWIIAAHDLLMWRRMPFAIASALIPPIGMTIILIMLSFAVTKQPIALVVQSHDLRAHGMHRIIQSDSDAYINYDFKRRLTPTDEKTAQRLLNCLQVAAIITVPGDFDMRVSQSSATVNLTLNNIDFDFADDIRRSVDRSVSRFDAPQFDLEEENEASERAEHHRFARRFPNPYLIDIDEHDLRHTNVKWLHYQIIPALVLLVLSVGLVGTALLCAQDVERKTARYLTLSPQHSWILVAGRLLGGVIASLIALAPAVYLCIILHIIKPPPGHWPALVAIFIATAVCASGMGAIIGTALRGLRTIAIASSVTATYMFFFGGGFTTIAFLPEWLQKISSFVPMRYAIDGIRQVLFYSTLDGVPKDLTILILTAVSAIIIGSYMVRRSWAQ